MALRGGLDVDLDILSIECDGDAGLIAMSEDISPGERTPLVVLYWGNKGRAREFVTVVAVLRAVSSRVMASEFHWMAASELGVVETARPGNWVGR